MKIFKLRAVLIALILGLVTISASANSDSNYLFIQNAKSAELIPTAKPGTYQLKLLNIEPYISYFSDRPNRITGLMPITKFLNNWKLNNPNSFSHDAPNAGFEGVKMHSWSFGKDIKLIISLNKPVYDSTEKTLTYTVHSLPNNNFDLTKPNKLANVSLFIDSGFCPCCGSGTC